jgi:hypothetical protein
MKLPSKIESFLNNGDAVVAEVPLPVPGQRCFVRIRPVANPDIAREEQRYLNSKVSLWDYWHFSFRRLVLRPGWETDEWNYDRYLISDERATSASESEFFGALLPWVPDLELLQHSQDSKCPE